MDLGRPGWIFGPGVVKAGRCEYNSGTNLVSSQPLVWSTRQVLWWWYGVSSISRGVFYDKMTSATNDTCTWTSVSAVNLCLSGVKYQQSNTWVFFLSQLSWTQDTLPVVRRLDQSENKALWTWMLLAEKGYKAWFSSLIWVYWSANW